MDTNRHISRSRTQQTEYSWPAQVQYSSHAAHTGGVTQSAAGSASYESFHEIIQSGYGRSKFNHCFHYRKRDNGIKGLFTGQHLLQISGNAPLDCVNPRTGPARFSRIAHLEAITAAKTALGATLLSESWNSWSTKGITKLQPDLTEISMPNFFYELKDLKKSILIKAQKGVYTKGLNAAKRLLYLKRNVKNLSTATLPAELVLELEYAVKPLINDLKEIWASMVSTRGKMDVWIESVGAKKTKSGILTKTADGSGGTFSPAGLGAGHSVTWTARREMSMSAFLRYRPLPFHNIKLLQGPLAFLDRYGVQLDALSVWNAIPFTFLLDYVLNIDQVLSNWNIDACELPIQIEDFCLQYKYDLKISSTHTATFSAFSNNSQSVTEVSPTWDFQETVFRRFPCIPHESGLIELGWKSPKLKQWWLGFNLATAVAGGAEAPKR